MDHNDSQLLIACDSESDVVLQSGNYSINEGDVPVNVQQDTNINRTDLRNKRWELNYHEAAIYLQEGTDNDKFRNHPGCLSALPTYLFTHNTFFYLLDLVASLGLLLLTLIEKPEVPGLKVPLGVHSSIELLCLMVIGLELGMRFKWLGCRSFFKHTRSVMKLLVLVVLFAESIAVLIRQTIHFRVTRAFRPIFLLDSYYCRGVRRFLRQIMQSMPPILDMLLLLLFFMLIFSILGFCVFSRVPNDQYFQTIEQSFISLFVLLTTANYPDVMMPAYAYNPWSVLFFVAYLAMELYFLMNLLLAVVYDVFSRLEKGKVKKLWLHKRTACCHAFKLLVSKQSSGGISLRHFSGVMSYFKPKLRRRDVYLVFKWLNTSQSGLLSREEFCRIYEVSDLRWKEKKPELPWFSDLPNWLKRVFKGIQMLVSSRYFEGFIYLVIGANFMTILIETILLSVKIEDKKIDPVLNHIEITWYSIMFVSIYCVEALLKVVGLGPLRYFSSGWNIFDFLVTLSALIGIFLQLAHSGFFYLVILRPFRLLRLFKMRRSFRDVLGTLFILLSRMTSERRIHQYCCNTHYICTFTLVIKNPIGNMPWKFSLAVVMLVLYYFFGVIGMECFSVYQMRNCCVNSSVESQYVYDNQTNTYGYYYLNNFDNILASYVTLFELTVVNNWFIIMEGYAVVATQWSRIYFMVFYIATMVVMTVVVAFILEAFLFRIQYRTKMHDHDTEEDAWMSVDVGLADEEIRMCNIKNLPLTGHYIQQAALADSVDGASSSSTFDITKYYRGTKLRGKMDFSLKMYEDAIEEWIQESEASHLESSTAIPNMNGPESDLRLRNNTV